MTIPNWLRIVLLIFTFASFLPQIRQLWTRRDSSGISLYYVLFNLMVATQILTIDLTVLMGVEESDVFVTKPISAGDWLNLAQFGAVWALWALVLVASIAFYPRDEARGVPMTVSAIYTTYLLITLVPIILVTASAAPKEDRRWFDAIFLFFHTYCLNPFITILGIAALYAQARTIRARPEGSGVGALSIVGLAAQAVVFFVVGFTWPGRLFWPFPILGRAFFIWIQMVGFVLVDYVIFAVVQADLLYIAMRHSGLEIGGGGIRRTGEREPLL
ncbi:hypothetical protein CPLU01_14136 [Colletotrichum plurivorum]|uniref:Uncharacterized protein n=1 Tax=Colletotrichum plurivorum TaxID=2175906 RepID=A0A8H6JLR8_9PEZI|nr:hypothetical protein CPLU01_14136 [Colletotrichum plurivorum]